MGEHDPLCPARRENWDDGSVWASPSPCQCDEYARVRADERERIAQKIEARTEVHSHLDVRCDFCTAFRSAAAIARGGESDG